MSIKGSIERYLDANPSANPSDVANLYLMEFTLGGDSAGWPRYPYLHDWLQYRSHSYRDPDCHMKTFFVRSALGWDSLPYDGKLCVDCANSIATYFDAFIKRLNHGQYKEYGHTDLLNNFDNIFSPNSPGITAEMEGFLNVHDRYIQACYSIGNYIPIPDGKVNQLGPLSKANYSDRQELFWMAMLENMEDSTWHARKEWYEKHADELAIKYWFENNRFTSFEESEIKQEFMKLSPKQDWLNGNENCSVELGSRVEYMNAVIDLTKLRGLSLAQRLLDYHR